MDEVLTLIEGAVVYAPEPRGVQSILLAGGVVIALGKLDRDATLASGLPCRVLDADGCLAVPGLIDPHAHLIGAGGEDGPHSREPEVRFDELIEAGVTSVVGVLGTDTTSRSPIALLAKTRQLREQGLSAYMFTGGFPIPPATITGSVERDLIIVEQAIGVGEIAISDTRSAQPSLAELSRVVAQAHTGGLVGGKAGVTHFHIGPGVARASLLHELLDGYEIAPSCLYATHVHRTTALLDDAIALARRGAYVDMDTVEETIPASVAYYREHEGPHDRLTISSDARTAGGLPDKFYRSFVDCILRRRMAVEDVVRLFSTNAAAALKLRKKGRLDAGADGDVLVLDRGTLAIRHLFARGRQLVADGHAIRA